jgi:hypothetical protein
MGRFGGFDGVRFRVGLGEGVGEADGTEHGARDRADESAGHVEEVGGGATGGEAETNGAEKQESEGKGHGGV